MESGPEPPGGYQQVAAAGVESDPAAADAVGAPVRAEAAACEGAAASRMAEGPLVAAEVIEAAVLGTESSVPAPAVTSASGAAAASADAAASAPPVALLCAPTGPPLTSEATGQLSVSSSASSARTAEEDSSGGEGVRISENVSLSTSGTRRAKVREESGVRERSLDHILRPRDHGAKEGERRPGRAETTQGNAAHAEMAERERSEDEEREQEVWMDRKGKKGDEGDVPLSHPPARTRQIPGQAGTRTAGATSAVSTSSSSSSSSVFQRPRCSSLERVRDGEDTNVPSSSAASYSTASSSISLHGSFTERQGVRWDKEKESPVGTGALENEFSRSQGDDRNQQRNVWTRSPWIFDRRALMFWLSKTARSVSSVNVAESVSRFKSQWPAYQSTARRKATQVARWMMAEDCIPDATRYMKRSWAKGKESAIKHFSLAKDFLMRYFLLAKGHFRKLGAPAQIAIIALLGLCKLLMLLLLIRTGCGHSSLSSPANMTASDPPPGGRGVLFNLEDWGRVSAVAICLSGDPSALPFTGPTIMRYVVSPFGSNARLYVSSLLNEHSHRLAAFGAPAQQVSGQQHELAAVRLWLVPPRNVSEALKRELASSAVHELRVADPGAMLSRWFLIEDSFALVREAEEQQAVDHQWVVTAEFDQVWSRPPPLPAFDSGKEITVPFTSARGGVNEFSSVCERQAANHFLSSRLSSLRSFLQRAAASASYDVSSSSRSSLMSPATASSILLRSSLRRNLLTHVSFATFPFCRLVLQGNGNIGGASSSVGSSAVGPPAVISHVLAVGSSGAVDGTYCYPCKPAATGARAWAVATEVGSGVGAEPLPNVLPDQLDTFAVCRPKLAELNQNRYGMWNGVLDAMAAAAASGQLGDGGRALLALLSGAGTKAEGAGGGEGEEVKWDRKQLAAWQKEPRDHDDCMRKVSSLARGGRLLGGGFSPEAVCLRWGVGPLRTIGMSNGAVWRVFADALDATSVVYSIGIYSDLSFDKAIIRTFSCDVYGWDATMDGMAWIEQQKRLPRRWHHVQFLLSLWDGGVLAQPLQQQQQQANTTASVDRDIGKQLVFSFPRRHGNEAGEMVPGKTLSSVARGFNHKKVDVLRIDMRGAECLLMEAIARLKDSSPIVCQLLVRHYPVFVDASLESSCSVARLAEAGFQEAERSVNVDGSLSLHFFNEDSTCRPGEGKM